jgi:hypothetical protein
MATRRKAPQDPTAAANAAVLAQRQERIDAKMQEVPDLGLNLEKADTPSAFLRDAWDKAAFGDAPRTITRIVYGPDNLIDTCPAFKDAIEKNGKQAYADATAQAILRFGHKAVPDPVMQKGLFASIRKFGAEAVAEAFHQRIMSIPERAVEYEEDTGDFGDPMMLGGNALRDCVMRYGNEPGKSYRFLSQRCIDVLGMRGYEFVMMPNGDPAKAGTLFLASIPLHIAERRTAGYAQESRNQVREMEESYMDAQERLLKQAGKVGVGSRPLKPSEQLTGYASENQDMVGGAYEMGVHVEREDKQQL